MIARKPLVAYGTRPYRSMPPMPSKVSKRTLRDEHSKATLGVDKESALEPGEIAPLGHRPIPGNAFPVIARGIWLPAPSRVRRAGPQTHVSQIDLHPIMTSAPGSPAGDPRASILTLAAYLPGSRHVHTQAHVHAHTHEHVCMHTPDPRYHFEKHVSDTSLTATNREIP